MKRRVLLPACILCTLLASFLLYFIFALSSLFLPDQRDVTHYAELTPEWMLVMPHDRNNASRCLVVSDAKELCAWLDKAKWEDSHMEDGVMPDAWLCLVEDRAGILTLRGFSGRPLRYNRAFHRAAVRYVGDISEGSHYVYGFSCPQTTGFDMLASIFPPAEGWYFFLPSTAAVTRNICEFTLAAPHPLSAEELARLEKEWGLLLLERPKY